MLDGCIGKRLSRGFLQTTSYLAIQATCQPERTTLRGWRSDGSKTGSHNNDFDVNINYGLVLSHSILNSANEGAAGKHRQEREEQQCEPVVLPNASATPEMQSEEESLTRFLSLPGRSPTAWTIDSSDQVAQTPFAEQLLDLHFTDQSETHDAF